MSVLNKHRRSILWTVAFGFVLQWVLYTTVVIRAMALPFVPLVPLGSYDQYIGSRENLQIVRVSEYLGGATVSVSESWASEPPPTDLRAWRAMPAVRAAGRVRSDLQVFRLRWIGITGPAMSGCLALDTKVMQLHITSTGIGVPALVGQGPVVVPLSPSPLWLAADWLVCTGIVAALRLGWAWARARRGFAARGGGASRHGQAPS